MRALYGLAADAIVVVHLFYVLFAVGGEALILAGALLRWGWVRRPLFRVCHLAACGLVALEAAAGVECPLTVWEYDLRLLAGQPAEKLSFIARLARLIVFYDFPAWVFTVVHISFGLLVVLTYILVPPRRRSSPLP